MTIREAFVASEGKKILAMDYSQIELRLMAHYSKDQIMLDSFKNNEDIHKRTASEVFSVEMENVTDEMRRRAKTINFGLLYGMSAFGLSNQLSKKYFFHRNLLELRILTHRELAVSFLHPFHSFQIL